MRRRLYDGRGEMEDERASGSGSGVAPDRVFPRIGGPVRRAGEEAREARAARVAENFMVSVKVVRRLCKSDGH